MRFLDGLAFANGPVAAELPVRWVIVTERRGRTIRRGRRTRDSQDRDITQTVRCKDGLDVKIDPGGGDHELAALFTGGFHGLGKAGAQIHVIAGPRSELLDRRRDGADYFFLIFAERKNPVPVLLVDRRRIRTCEFSDHKLRRVAVGGGVVEIADDKQGAFGAFRALCHGAGDFTARVAMSRRYSAPSKSIA